MSVARVAQAEGVNSHQVFQWRREYRKGELEAGHCERPMLPVVVDGSDVDIAEVQGRRAMPALPEAVKQVGAIHIEFPGRATISVESGADRELLRMVLESLRH